MSLLAFNMPHPQEIRHLKLQLIRQQQPASDDTVALGMVLKQHSKHVIFFKEQRLDRSGAVTLHPCACAALASENFGSLRQQVGWSECDR